MDEKEERIDTFANRLRRAMIIRGMKQTDLVSKTKLSKQQISQYVNGKFEAKQRAVFLLAQALEVTEPWLMGFDVPMEKEEVQSQQCENYEECQKKDIKPLISKILQLDERDKGKISERVDMLLESDKYNYQKELKHA